MYSLLLFFVTFYITPEFVSSRCTNNPTDSEEISALCYNQGRKYDFGVKKDWDNYSAPWPGYGATYDPIVQKIIFVVSGIQITNPTNQDIVVYHNTIQQSLNDKHSFPAHWDVSSFVDSKGILNINYFSYFNDTDSFSNFYYRSAYSQFMASDHDRISSDFENSNGFYSEVFFFPIENTETIHGPSLNDYKQHNLKGISNIAISFFKDKRHGYWGAMRDRMNASAFNAFIGCNHCSYNSLMNGNDIEIDRETRGKRFEIPVPTNLNIIRSGQDISNGNEMDKNVYLSELEPVLMKGMNYLKDNPTQTNCIELRFISDLNKTSVNHVLEGQTAGFGYFLNLSDLENWSKSHKTHISIFSKLMQLFKDGHLSSIYLWHEVFVSQYGFANYVNVHNQTGFLRWYDDQCHL